MANKVLLKKSSTAAKVPTTSDLDYGELALNYADGKLFYKNSSNVVQSFATASYVRLTSNTTAIAGKKYICDTSAGTFTLTLPATPVTGDSIIIADGSDFSVNTLTVARNSSTIDGTADNLSLNIGGVEVTLTFDGTTWNVYAQVGAAGGGAPAAAATLTGTSLNSTVVSSSLTSLGTLTNLNLSSGGISTNGIRVGATGQVFDDGNFHIHSSAGVLWLNASDNSNVNINTQTTGGVNLGGVTSMNSGYGSVAPVYGVRAWINCGWNGSSFVTRASGNLSGSRSSTGSYAFTFGTAMPDANYSVVVTCQTPSSNSDAAVNITYNTTLQTTGFQITLARYGTGNLDSAIICIQVVR